jgi:hypothetical protein
MSIDDEINGYIDAQAPAKRQELGDLHRRVLAIAPDARRWYLDGRDETGKVVSNQNIGYGETTLTYADGGSRPFYRLGLSANTSGLSVYVMGLADKAFLAETYGARLGKAKITGYCIRFRSLKDLDVAVLEEVFADALGAG